MEILHAKTLELRQTSILTPERQVNSDLNRQEAVAQKTVLQSLPRRLVFELTNRCNLNCVMCGRNSAKFFPTEFQLEWLNRFESITDRVEEVTLMGWGEPTVHPHFVDFLQWAHLHGLRKYFCTNGMRLNELFLTIFEQHVDIIAVSLDGSTQKTNAQIRRGADFDHITNAIRRINQYKNQNHLDYPYTNLVFTAMRNNIDQVPDMVRLAAKCGMNELKVVFLTAFDQASEKNSLFNDMEHTKTVFNKAIQEAKRLDINLKIPHLRGEDPAGDQMHKTCYVGWRDFFLGSDGYVRPCMSTAQKLLHINEYQSFEEMWNCSAYQELRANVNKGSMPCTCKSCYQSSFANWNRKESFIQIGKEFSPEWQSKG